MRQLAVIIGLLIGVYIGSLSYSKHRPVKYHVQTTVDTPIEPPTTPVKPVTHKEVTHKRVIKELGNLPNISVYQVKSRALSDKDFRCLALNVFHEAKGESLTGQMGVAQVTLNRLDTGFRNKKTICGVVFDPKQFSWTADNTKRAVVPKGNAWDTALLASRSVINGQRIKGLEWALHYHANYIKHPVWSQKMLLCHAIGQHIYLREEI